MAWLGTTSGTSSSNRAPSLAVEQDQRDAATDQQAKQQFHDKRSFNWVAVGAPLWGSVSAG
ncbi:hypothetical protein D3C72_1582010 [compost metagenome]